MKIMFITPNINGGMIHYISQLANSLVNNGYEIVVIGPKGLDRSCFNVNIKIIETHVGNTTKNFFKNTLLVFRCLSFLRTINDENPDIIHFNGCHLWLGLFLPFLRRYPLITTIHDANPHLGSRKFDYMISKKLFIKYSRYLVVHGLKIKEELKANKSCFIVPLGDFSFFSNYLTSDISEEANSALFFGRIEEYKGLDYLLAAIPLIQSKIPDFKLIIAGEGSLEKYKDIISKTQGLEIHNHFIPNNEVPIFFKRCNVVVLPYVEGSQSGVISIAYAFKKPVIATRVGSIPEAIDEGLTGKIVPPRDAKALAGAILELMGDINLRKHMGDNARKKMENELSWEKITIDIVKIYNMAIKATYLKL